MHLQSFAKNLVLPKRNVFAFVVLLVLNGCASTVPIADSMAAATPISNCGVTETQLEQLRSSAKMAVDKGFAPGVATLIYCNGAPLVAHEFGYADTASKKPLLPDSLYRIYSMTKPVTSVAIMMLVEDGKLALDDPISRFIPEFAQAKVYLSGDATADIKTTALNRAPTIRDLLRHTAGLTYRGQFGPVQKQYVQRGIDNGGGAVVLPDDKSAPVVTVEEFARRIAAIPMLYQPGERFTYGNATDVLGRVVDVAAAKPMRAFMQERIFTPLGMTDTGFDVPAANIDRLANVYFAKSSAGTDRSILRATDTATLTASPLTLAEDSRKSIFAKPRSIDFGGAGLVSSAADYQKFMQLLLGMGQVGGKRLLQQQSVTEMTRNQLSTVALAGGEMPAQGLGFGLGFAVYVAPEKAPVSVSPAVYFWGGAASTYFWVDPDRKLSGVVMTQVFGGDMTPFYVDMLRAVYPKDVAKAQSNIALK